MNLLVPYDKRYLPYQEEGIRWLLQHPNALLADQMGLGKTVQVCGLINNLDRIPRVLIVCPASLKRNWQRELAEWCPFLPSIYIVEGSEWDYSVDYGVVIVNYDILQRHHGGIRSRMWDILVLDECHYLKSFYAQRTKQVIGTRAFPGIPAQRKIALTGTPIVNRPVELYPILRYLDGKNWPDYDAFGRRYCEGTGKVIVQSFGPKGSGLFQAWKQYFGPDSKPVCTLEQWDKFSRIHNPYGMRTKRLPGYMGACNLGELNERLRSTVMLRRMKADVLKDLPAKVREVIELDPESKQIRNLIRQERELWAKLGIDPTQQWTASILSLAGQTTENTFEIISSLRKEVALAKIPQVIEHLHEAVDSSGKVVVFIHHHETADALQHEFKGECVAITGETPSWSRQGNVDRFQKDPDCRLFIGSRAAAEGITLTASSHVVIAEWQWEPGILDQMEDRCHRIGQKDSVLVQHLVLAGSLDAAMAKTVVRKQRVIAEAIN